MTREQLAAFLAAAMATDARGEDRRFYSFFRLLATSMLNMDDLLSRPSLVAFAARAYEAAGCRGATVIE